MGRPKTNLGGFVWSYQSINGLISQRQFTPKCSFLARVGLLDFVLSEYPGKFHSFRNLIFMTSSLKYSLSIKSFFLKT